jgi:hypothetical protein
MWAYDNATVMGISGVRKGGEFDVRTRHWTVYGSASGFMETHQCPKPAVLGIPKVTSIRVYKSPFWWRARGAAEPSFRQCAVQSMGD